MKSLNSAKRAKLSGGLVVTVLFVVLIMLAITLTKGKVRLMLFFAAVAGTCVTTPVIRSIMDRVALTDDGKKREGELETLVNLLEVRQEELLREVAEARSQAARSEAIIAALGEGISIQSRDFTVLYQNEMLRSWVGDRIGEVCYRAYEGEVKPCEACPVASTFADGGTHSVERVLNAPGAEQYLEICTSPLKNAEGEVIAAIELVRDVTERKLAERKVAKLNRDLQQQAKELGAKNRELETFSYSLAHDLKNPLTSIYASAQALVEDTGKVLTENGRFFLATILKSSERMEEVLDSMLLLGRISESELQYENINLSDYARIILLQLKIEHPERDVEPVIAEGITVTGDPRLLRSALENLLVNAWKYTRNVQHGRIEVGATTQPDGSNVCFIRDNGAGFDMARSGDLFQPFHRLHPAQEFEGSGIGLATVQRIMQRHGGRVWAEGAVARGATFFFSLPQQPPVTGDVPEQVGTRKMVDPPGSGASMG